jgi:hypothetical protein
MSLVPAVVDDHVDHWDFFAKGSPKCWICLVADEDSDAVGFVSTAVRLDVDSIYAGTRAEVMSPHPQASSAEDADFDHVYLAADELSEVALVYREVMAPLPDPGALGVVVEIGLKCT